MNKELLKQHFKGPYAIKEVLDYIDTIDSIYNYEYHNIKCIVYFRKSDKINKFKIREVIKRAYKIGNKTKNIIINLIMSPVKKILETDRILTVKNINSGFTYKSGNEIFIFREEEYPKVIIHEIIHHDKSIDNDKFSETDKNRLMEYFEITKDSILILNETIIEFWATLVHIAYVSCKYKIDFLELYKIELQYSLLKTYQILKLKETYKDKMWCDRCNIYSYIVFKTILLVNINDFFKIYTYPYNNTKITEFIIKKSGFLKELVKKPSMMNPKIKINSQIIQRPLDSLCFMLSSDL